MGELASPMAARQSLKLWGQSGRVKTAPKPGGLVWFKSVDGGRCGLEDFSRSKVARALLDSPFFVSQVS